MKRELIIGIIIGLILGVVIGIILFKEQGVSSSELKCHWYCNVDLTRVGCASDFDCDAVGGVCNLNTFRCVPGNVNLNISFSGTEQDCISIGGRWELGLGS
jgi:hypothetical protein